MIRAIRLELDFSDIFLLKLSKNKIIWKNVMDIGEKLEVFGKKLNGSEKKLNAMESGDSL